MEYNQKDVTIIAGCGIHNDGEGISRHDGVHTFHVQQNARVMGHELFPDNEGSAIGQLGLGDTFGGIDALDLYGVHLHIAVGDQYAETEFEVELNGVGSSANVISRSVAKGRSEQVFLSKIDGNNQCYGHSECDAIIMDSASVKAIPEVTANHVDASLIHEAAIGKIAGEQITKLMTLGLTQGEAEAQIVNGFLK